MAMDVIEETALAKIYENVSQRDLNYIYDTLHKEKLTFKDRYITDINRLVKHAENPILFMENIDDICENVKSDINKYLEIEKKIRILEKVARTRTVELE